MPRDTCGKWKVHGVLVKAIMQHTGWLEEETHKMILSDCRLNPREGWAEILIRHPLKKLGRLGVEAKCSGLKVTSAQHTVRWSHNNHSEFDVMIVLGSLEVILEKDHKMLMDKLAKIEGKVLDHCVACHAAGKRAKEPLDWAHESADADRFSIFIFPEEHLNASGMALAAFPTKPSATSGTSLRSPISDSSAIIRNLIAAAPEFCDFLKPNHPSHQADFLAPDMDDFETPFHKS